MTGTGVERVPSPGRGLLDVRPARGLRGGAARTAAQGPGAVSYARDIVEEWLRGMTILAHGAPYSHSLSIPGGAAAREDCPKSAG